MSAQLPVRGWLFPLVPDPTRPCPPHLVSQQCNGYLHSIGIDSTLHSLRHWFCTEFYRRSGRDLRLTQEAARHRSPATTAGYTAIDPVEIAAVSDLLRA